MAGKELSDSECTLEQKLLAEFRLYPGMTLRQAAAGYIADTRRRMNPHEVLFYAACAIKAGDEAFAAALLGID